MKQLVNFFKEVKLELEKVTWPKREVVVNYLGLVITISAVVAIFVGGVDYGLTKGLENLIK
jgi:preprotein translocase subunit SecE